MTMVGSQKNGLEGFVDIMLCKLNIQTLPANKIEIIPKEGLFIIRIVHQQFTKICDGTCDLCCYVPLTLFV